MVHYFQTLAMQAVIPIERSTKLTFDKFHALLALDKKPDDIKIVIFQAILKNLQHTFNQRKLQFISIQCFKYIPHIPLIVIIPQSVLNRLSYQFYRRLNCQSRTIGQHTHGKSLNIFYISIDQLCLLLNVVGTYLHHFCEYHQIVPDTQCFLVV